MKTLLCTIVKNENNYLQEFIDHYKNLGITKIIIYDNNDVDGETIDIKDKKVSIVNARGKEVYQMTAYNQCYEKYKSKYDWMLFFDCDEFLYLDYKYKRIGDYLNNPIFKDFDCIKINWQVYGDDDIEKSDIYSVKRFSHPVQPIDFKVDKTPYPQNWHVKSIVRCKEELNINFQNPHCPFGVVNICNNAGIRCGNYPFEPMNYTYAVLNHYHTKTINEYIKKIDRGFADIKRIYNKQDLEYQLNLFFEYNNRTEYKTKQIEEYLKNKVL